ncbi:MAG: calcium/sodium antiporter [Bacteroidia bacterium]|nr:calcium/sodium antiporter [Bacteroidia bacterium]
MIGLPFWSIIFFVTLVTLVISADFFIKSSERIGLALGIPPFVVGVTLIAIGTSLPELITSVVAVLSKENASAIVPGNVIGSNITNIGLVLGVVAFRAKKIKLEFDVLKVDGPMLVGATFLLYLCLIDGNFTLFEGIVFCLGLIIYLAYIFSLRNADSPEDIPIDIEVDEAEGQKFSWKEPVILLVSGLVIYLSADYNVQSIQNLANLLNIGKEFIALTAVALGTSLPELVVSLVAIRTGNVEMAVGNVIGSNIFNIFAVMGIPRLIGHIEVPETILGTSLPAVLFISILCFVVVMDRKVNRWEGLVLLLFYIAIQGGLIAQV